MLNTALEWYQREGREKSVNTPFPTNIPIRLHLVDNFPPWEIQKLTESCLNIPGKHLKSNWKEGRKSFTRIPALDTVLQGQKRFPTSHLKKKKGGGWHGYHPNFSSWLSRGRASDLQTLEIWMICIAQLPGEDVNGGLDYNHIYVYTHTRISSPCLEMSRWQECQQHQLPMGRIDTCSQYSCFAKAHLSLQHLEFWWVQQLLAILEESCWLGLINVMAASSDSSESTCWWKC